MRIKISEAADGLEVKGLFGCEHNVYKNRKVQRIYFL
jgi:hypothetical protein